MSVDPLDPGPSLREALERIVGADPSFVPVALGWATVDLDRARRAFADAFDGSIEAPGAAANDILLGAHCLLIRTSDPDVPVVVLLEPFTEGRLAATLARHGEGPAAAWVRTSEPGSHEPRSSDSPDRWSGDARGPFGWEVLLPGPASGPHRLLLVAAPGTITP